MQNIQDLKEKVFSESKNIIGILDKISTTGELLSKQDLVDELANRISFLRLLEQNIAYFTSENSSTFLEKSEKKSSVTAYSTSDELSEEILEEEAVFNNALNEVNKDGTDSFSSEITEEEAIFNNQLNEIVESELHETLINFVEDSKSNESDDDTNVKSEDIFSRQLNEIEESELSEYHESSLSFVDEERILADSEPDHDEDIHEEMFDAKTTEEEAIFNNQLNEIDEFENEISESQGEKLNDFDEEEKIQNNFENAAPPISETIPGIFENEITDDELPAEEEDEQLIASHTNIAQGEMITETSGVENILNEIKNDAQTEEKHQEDSSERRKIVEIDKPQIEKEIHPSDESFENLEQYHHDKKIKLSNIKGLKAVKTLFDDDPLEREFPEHTEKSDLKDTGSILKTNIPTQYMEAEKRKPEFKLDLNDRIAFSKTLFAGSQLELNEVVAALNSFRTLEEAKEYLSDLYYEKKWSKVDEYAQRLWILVENKFL